MFISCPWPWKWRFRKLLDGQLRENDVNLHGPLVVISAQSLITTQCVSWCRQLGPVGIHLGTNRNGNINDELGEKSGMRSSFLTTNSFSVIIREGHTSTASGETHSKSTPFSYIFIPGLVMLCSEKPPLLSCHP